MGAKEQLKNAITNLSEENARIVLKFVLFLLDEEEGLTEEDLTAIRRGEEQIALGEAGSLDDLKRELNL